MFNQKIVIMKTFITILFVIISFNLFSQKFGIKTGFHLSNLIEKVNDVSTSDYKMTGGAHLGGVIDFKRGENTSFQTGLLITTMGCKINSTEFILGDEYKTVGNVNLIYIDVPLITKFTHDLGNAKIFGELGIYFSYGILGNYNIKTSYMGISEQINEKIDWNSDFKRIDFGPQLGAGLIFKDKYQIGLSFKWGTANIAHGEPVFSGDVIDKNIAIGIYMTTFFGK